MIEHGPIAGPSHRRLRTARLAVFAVFGLNGFLAAMWVAHIPVISDQTGINHDQLGGLLLLLGGSAFVAMQVCGPVIDRWGSRPTTIIAGVALCLAVLIPAAAHSAPVLAAGLAAFGFANGALDVSMNAQAVAVERAYRRPIMSAFHGFFSLGGLVGSGVVALLLWLGVEIIVTVAGACVTGLVAVAITGPVLLARDETAPERDAGTVEASSRWWHQIDRRRLILLAAVAFALMLAEGTAYDWSALQVVETFGVGDAVGAIAFGAFSAAMTVARFGVDRVVARVGAGAVVRYGTSLGLVGMVIAVTAVAPGWAILGWTVFGVGLAGLIPQIFTAAGNLSATASARAISTVVGCGYLGMLAGPAVVGFISSRSSLTVGLCVAIVALVFAAVAAPVVSGRAPEDVTTTQPDNV